MFTHALKDLIKFLGLHKTEEELSKSYIQDRRKPGVVIPRS
jgi:hypothetical protein